MIYKILSLIEMVKRWDKFIRKPMFESKNKYYNDVMLNK